MRERKMTRRIVAVVVVCCAVMCLVDGVLRPPYLVKSAVKAALFLLGPLLCGAWSEGQRAAELFRADRKALRFALTLGAAIFLVIMGAYLLLRRVFDFSPITALLGENAGVTRENFLWVSCYVALVNSLLEEFFFRGFAYLRLRKAAGERFAQGFSALSFALYHTAMLLGWFSPWLFVLALAGLFAGGLIFNALDARGGTIIPSWCAHLCANLAINAVGFLLFRLI